MATQYLAAEKRRLVNAEVLAYHTGRTQRLAAEKRRYKEWIQEKLTSAPDFETLLCALQGIPGHHIGSDLQGALDARKIISWALLSFDKILRGMARSHESAEARDIDADCAAATLILLEMSVWLRVVRIQGQDLHQGGTNRQPVDRNRSTEADEALACVIESLLNHSDTTDEFRAFASDSSLQDALRDCIFSSIAGDIAHRCPLSGLVVLHHGSGPL